MKSLPLSVGLTIAFLGANAMSGQAPRHKIETEIVGPPWVQGTVYTQSPKGSRLASTYAKDGQWVVAIDNVAGELFDDILKTANQVIPEFNDAEVVVSQSTPAPGPVAFSRDGSRYAYAGLRGGDVIVILDGKEIFRAKQSHVAPPVSLLQFSPDGRHLFFYNATADTLQSSFRLMMDGMPATPAFDGNPPIIFNADGSRWILNGGRAKPPREKLLVVDGKEQEYSAERARFSPDGKKIVCTTGGRGEQKLLVDGKVVLDTKATIERFRVSTTGDIAVIVQKMPNDQNQLLFINGKPIAGVENIHDIVFSPDGKRWAARCHRDMNTIAWYVVDGKKHQEYKSVSGIMFSPDSSKAVYLAETGVKKFVVTNGEEDEGHLVVGGMAFARTGNKFAYVAGPNYVFIRYDGKVSPQLRMVHQLEMSPDGNRFAYFATEGEYPDFVVDGEKKGNAGTFSGKVFFSSDSQHVAASTLGTDGATVYLDGEFLPARRSLGTPREFTPDSRHLIVTGSVTDPARPVMSLNAFYVDGQEVARFSGIGVPWLNSPTRVRPVVGVLPWGASTAKIDPDAKDWAYLPDGRIVFLGVAPAPPGASYGPMIRITVTPAPDTTFANWPRDIRTAMEQEAAAALAAKEKAAADKAAAAAKAKAAAEAAAAAKAKARQDALDAKKKAQADAAAKKTKP